MNIHQFDVVVVGAGGAGINGSPAGIEKCKHCSTQ